MRVAAFADRIFRKSCVSRGCDMKTAMILAAGRGERLRPLTDTCPKPLIRVRGKPLIFYHLEALARAGITKVVINICYLAQQLQSAIGDGSRFGVEVVYSHEVVALQAGGGIVNALPLLGNEPFIVVSADIFTDFPFWRLKLQPNTLGHLILVKNPHWHHGDLDLAQQHKVVVGTEHTPYTFSGIGIYHPDFFSYATSGIMSILPFFTSASERGQLTGEVYAGLWTDVGTIDRLHDLEKILSHKSAI